MQISAFMPCGLGLVQERTLVMTPPPQEALQGVDTVDQGLQLPLMLMMTFCPSTMATPRARHHTNTLKRK